MPSPRLITLCSMLMEMDELVARLISELEEGILHLFEHPCLKILPACLTTLMPSIVGGDKLEKALHGWLRSVDLHDRENVGNVLTSETVDWPAQPVRLPVMWRALPFKRRGYGGHALVRGVILV